MHIDMPPFLVDILHHDLLVLLTNIWHAINIAKGFPPSIYMKLGPNDYYFEIVVLRWEL